MYTAAQGTMSNFQHSPHVSVADIEPDHNASGHRAIDEDGCLNHPENIQSDQLDDVHLASAQPQDGVNFDRLDEHDQQHSNPIVPTQVNYQHRNELHQRGGESEAGNGQDDYNQSHDGQTESVGRSRFEMDATAADMREMSGGMQQSELQNGTNEGDDNEVEDNTTLARLAMAQEEQALAVSQPHPKRSRISPTTARATNAAGRRMCDFSSCGKQAIAPTLFCVSHGGGVRCSALGCTKGACKPTAFCVAHGGGRRCSSPGCASSAQGRTMRCVRHGGGKRCQTEHCTKSAAGTTKHCKAHGGGRRCNVVDCKTSAEGRTYKCKVHGGGKRCVRAACSSSAVRASSYCRKHGGGRACAQHGCRKSAFGVTTFCRTHQPDDMRCRADGCSKLLEHSKVDPAGNAVHVDDPANIDSETTNPAVTTTGEGVGESNNAVEKFCTQHATPSRSRVPPVNDSVVAVEALQDCESQVVLHNHCNVTGCDRIAADDCAKGRRTERDVLLTVSHCQAPTCQELCLRDATFCNAHGGGLSCAFDGCFSARDGPEFCRLHDGSMCAFEGCRYPALATSDDTKTLLSFSALSSLRFCTSHIAGKPCLVEGCREAFVSPVQGVCQTHSGGLLCSAFGCMRQCVFGTHLCRQHRGGNSWTIGSSAKRSYSFVNIEI
jgi:hypothetical protein